MLVQRLRRWYHDIYIYGHPHMSPEIDKRETISDATYLMQTPLTVTQDVILMSYSIVKYESEIIYSPYKGHNN